MPLIHRALTCRVTKGGLAPHSRPVAFVAPFARRDGATLSVVAWRIGL